MHYCALSSPALLQFANWMKPKENLSALFFLIAAYENQNITIIFPVVRAPRSSPILTTSFDCNFGAT